jgi:hypothetical protein
MLLITPFAMVLGALAFGPLIAAFTLALQLNQRRRAEVDEPGRRIPKVTTDGASR